MRLIAAAAFCGLIAAPAAADDWADCEALDRSLVSIDACTRLIDSGTLAGRDLATAYFNRAYSLDEVGHYAEAISDLTLALNLHPTHGDSWRNRGVAYENMGVFDKAAADWETEIEVVGPESARWWQEWTRDNGGHYDGPIDGRMNPQLRDALYACAVDPSC